MGVGVGVERRLRTGEEVRIRHFVRVERVADLPQVGLLLFIRRKIRKVEIVDFVVQQKIHLRDDFLFSGLYEVVEFVFPVLLQEVGGLEFPALENWRRGVLR